MLENLQDLVRQHAGETIINNPAIPNERNEEVIADASSSILNGLKSSAAQGNTNSITELFSGGGEAALSSPLTQNIQGGFIQNLMHKFGLDQGSASSIAGSLIPAVLGKLVHKTNDPNDSSFNLGSILGSLTGGAGMGNILNNLGGGNNKENKGNDGILDKVKGMFD